MKRSLLLLSLSLLAACSQPTTIAPPLGGNAGGTGTNPGTNPPSAGTATPGTGPDDVPNVVRAKRPIAPDCSVKSLVSQISGGNLADLRYVNQSSALKAQASASTLLGLLFDTRKAINTKYYGFSSVDLQALHETYETKFRSSLGNLNGPITASADTLMAQYIGGVNDEHTYYLSAEQYQRFADQGNGAPTPTPRFGFSLAPVPGEDGLVLTDVLGDTPAAAAGLRRGDTILAVNGAALGSDAVASSGVLGRAAQTGQPVTLSIRRGEAPLTITLTPRIISSAELPVLSFSGSGKVALIRIPTFNNKDVAQRVHDLVRQAQSKGATSMILDLRDNGGGYVSEATGVAAAFAPAQAGQKLETLDAQDVTFFYTGNAQQGVVGVSGVGRDPATNACAPISQPLLTINLPATWTGKLAVIVNAGSASASEVVSNILRKTGAAAVGEATVGVGNTAITLEDLPGKRGLAVTIARSRGLDGVYLPEKVTPDVSAADDLKQLAHGRDLPLEAATAKVQ